MSNPWKGVVASLSVAAAVLMLVPSRDATAGTPASFSNQVSICHFAGHDGDFVTFNSAGNDNVLCDDRGGNAITVGRAACKNGHRAAAIPQAGNKDCDTTDQP